MKRTEAAIVHDPFWEERGTRGDRDLRRQEVTTTGWVTPVDMSEEDAERVKDRERQPFGFQAPQRPLRRGLSRFERRPV